MGIVCQFSYSSLLDSTPTEKSSFLWFILFGIIFGITNGAFFLFFDSLLISYIGKKFQGTASFREVSVAYVWSAFPFLLTSFFSMFITIVSTQENFYQIFFPHRSLFSFFLSSLFFISYVWVFILFIEFLSELNHFSRKRAIGVILLEAPISLGSLYLFKWLIRAIFHLSRFGR